MNTKKTTNAIPLRRVLSAFLIVIMLIILVPPPFAQGATYTVDTDQDIAYDANHCTPGFDCTLRAAITNANANPGADTINFDAGMCATAATIQLLASEEELPAIDDVVVIDGLCNGNPVTIDGTNATTDNGAAADSGLRFITGSDGSSANDLIITNFDDHGVYADANDITLDDITADGNGLDGFAFNGTALADLTGLVSINNGSDGISIDNGASDFVVDNSYIGVEDDGSTAGGNGGWGVYIDNADNNTLDSNVISDNTSGGISLSSATSNGNTITDNMIGVNGSGNAGIGNGGYGVYISEAVNTTVGPDNVIGDNTTAVRVDDVAIIGTEISDNYIGTNTSGTTNLGNSDWGVYLDNTYEALVLYNVIFYNGDDGVAVISGTMNIIYENYIYSNGGLGIDLGSSGVTANDSGDTDSGANELQNFPILTSAETTATETVVEGTLNSANSSDYWIDFFLSETCDSSGYGEGRYYLDSTIVTTDASGDATISHSLAPLTSGQYITALALDMVTGDTSEFSACRQITGSGSPTATASNTLDITVTVENDANHDGTFHSTETTTVNGDVVTYKITVMNNEGFNVILVDYTDTDFNIGGKCEDAIGDTIHSHDDFSCTFKHDWAIGELPESNTSTVRVRNSTSSSYGWDSDTSTVNYTSATSTSSSGTYKTSTSSYSFKTPTRTPSTTGTPPTATYSYGLFIPSNTPTFTISPTIDLTNPGSGSIFDTKTPTASVEGVFSPGQKTGTAEAEATAEAEGGGGGLLGGNTSMLLYCLIPVVLLLLAGGGAELFRWYKARQL